MQVRRFYLSRHREAAKEGNRAGGPPSAFLAHRPAYPPRRSPLASQGRSAAPWISLHGYRQPSLACCLGIYFQIVRVKWPARTSTRTRRQGVGVIDLLQGAGTMLILKLLMALAVVLGFLVLLVVGLS